MNRRAHLAAWRALAQRYRAVWQDCWRQRHTLDQPTRHAHEAEFLPAAMALQARPVAPAGRWVARLLMALIACALVWSVWGEADIVVNAAGRIVPAGRTKTITSVETASVRALYVTEGQVVKAGDPLIELDARSSEADADKATGEWQTAFLVGARARALLEALDQGGPPVLPPAPQVPIERWQDAAQHLRDHWRDLEARRTRLDGEIERYSQAVPLATRRARDYAELVATRDVATHAWLDKEQQRIDLEGQLADARNQKAALLAEARKNARETLSEAQRIMAAARQDARRATVRGELLKLLAPVDGTVQQLTAHTVGAAIPAAQALMQIVPARGVVEMQALIENKDVGFVQAGQTAEVKIDTFPYTRYGTVPARVTHVSRDAISDDKRGLIYSVRVELARAKLLVDGQWVALTPGMSGRVEIKTGTRRLIEYVLAPLIEHGQERLRER